MSYFEKAKNHLNTVNTHRKCVRELCFKCGIYYQGLVHDLSKYNPVEFVPSVQYWTGKKSPIDIEIDEKGYSNAWLHHKGKNKHHYEYWLDPVHMDQPVQIPKRYLAEMFCDRVGACKAYMGDNFDVHGPLNYMISREDKECPLMNPISYQRLRYFFNILAEHGEDYACNFVKTWVRDPNRY